MRTKRRNNRARCDVCGREITVVKAKRNYQRLAKHEQRVRPFIECSGSGKRILEARRGNA